MVRIGMVAMVLALAAAPLVAQESTESLRKELEALRAEVDGLKASKEVPASMAPEGDSPLMTALKQTKLSGFVDAGYVVSFNHMHNEVGNAGNPARAFDNLGNSFYLNNVQLNLERLASKDMIVGYHIELSGGHDFSVYEGSNFGIQEGWVQILAPVGSGLDIRVGKMATLTGYEVVESLYDMNYSRGLLFQNMQPITATGVRAAYALNEMFTFTFGFINGANPSGATFEDTNHGKAIEAQVAVKSGDLSAFVTLNWGNEGPGGVGGNDHAYLFDIVVQYVMGQLTLAGNLDFSAFHDGGPGDNNAPKAGIALYGKYAFSDMVSEALRVEYFSDKEGVAFNPVTADDAGTGARIISLTATTEFKIAQQLILRVELRHDQSNNHIFVRDGSAARGDTTFGMEAIMPF